MPPFGILLSACQESVSFNFAVYNRAYNGRKEFLRISSQKEKKKKENRKKMRLRVRKLQVARHRFLAGRHECAPP